MSDLPEWILDPDNKASAGAMAADIAGAIARRKLEEVAERMSTTETFDPVQILAMPRFQADVAFDTMRATAQLQACADRSLNHQAVNVIDNNLFLHHSNEYETAEQFFEDAIGEIDRSQSEISDLRTYHDLVLPYLERAGLNGSSHLWVKGENVAKARAAAPILRKLFHEIDVAGDAHDAERVTKAQAEIETVTQKVIDPNVSKRDFIAAKHGAGLATDMGQFTAWKYLQGEGCVMVMLVPMECQRAFIEQALGDYADWKLGAGKEPVLALLGVPPEQLAGEPVEGFVEASVAS